MSGTASPGPSLTFVIPVRNDAVQLRRCLASITAATANVTTELVVVDNGSDDDSAAVAAAAGCRVLVVPGERVGSLRNRGAAVASGRLLAFVDSDHDLDGGWGSAAVESMAGSSVSAAGAPCHPPDRATWVQRAYDGLRQHPAAPREVEWLGSGNLVVRRDVFDRIGGFDPTLEACEDVDLCRRIRQDGGTLVSDPRMKSIHYGDPASLAALFKSELWRGRNNLLVSLRERPSLRGLPSILIPVGQLVLSVSAVVAALFGKPLMVAACLTAVLLPLLARATAIRRRAGVPFHHAAAVAGTYDAARALALLLKARHRRADPAAVPATQ